MKKRLCSALLSVLLPLLLWAAAVTPDSLLRSYEQGGDGAAKLSAANRFLHVLYEAGLADADYQYDARVPADTLEKHLCYWAAEYSVVQQRYQQAIGYALRALPFCENGVDTDLEGSCLNLLSISYQRLGDYPQAARFAHRCYALDLKSGDAGYISNSLNTLAGIYISANRPKEALAYALKGIDYCEQAGNAARLATLHGMASEACHALGDQQRALDYASMAYREEQELGRRDKQAIRLSQMAAALTGLHRFAEARRCLEKAMPQLEADGNLHSLGICCNKMGEALKWEKRMGEAARYFARGAEIFQQLGDPYNEVHSQLGLYNSLKDSLPTVAMRYLERYNQLRDTIYSREVADSMAFYHAKVGNAELLSDNAQQRSRARTFILLCGGVLLVLFVVTVFLLWLLHRRNKQFARQFNALSSSLEAARSEQLAQQPEAPSQAQPARAELSESDRLFLAKVEAIANRQIDEGRVDVGALAQECCMSITAFRRKFSALVDEKPQAYIMRLRMEKARQLLVEHPELNVAEVGMRIGFDDKSNFTRAFKHAFGMTPTEFLKK